MCGEKKRGRPKYGRRWGSPPRVRGKESTGIRRAKNERITPACAGKSHVYWGAYDADEDHPRVCGEKRRTGPTTLPLLGSPPRVRGKVRLPSHKSAPLRITPACAGKRLSDREKKIIERDHPRVCGEKHQRAAWMRRPEGSPPRVRGKGRVNISA